MSSKRRLELFEDKRRMPLEAALKKLSDQDRESFAVLQTEVNLHSVDPGFDTKGFSELGLFLRSMTGRGIFVCVQQGTRSLPYKYIECTC